MCAQVRSSVDEEDVSYTGEDCRFIETTTSASDDLPDDTPEQQSAVQQSHEEGCDVPPSSAGAQSASLSKSMWQRLKGIGRQQRKVGFQH